MKFLSLRTLSYGLALVGVPVAATALYIQLGNPGMPDHPLEQRRSDQTQTMSQVQVEALVAGRVRETSTQDTDPEFINLIKQLQTRIIQTGGDVRGYELLGGALARVQRYREAADAFAQAASLSNEPRHKVLQLENMFAAADGYMSHDAIVLLESVKDFDNFRISYYQGVVAAQKGNLKDAAQIWTQTLQRTDVPAQLAQTLDQQIQQANQEIGLNTPTTEAVENYRNMTPEERDIMVNNMVSGLADKLDNNPDDLAGWLQIIQAYHVLERKEEAAKALATARKFFMDNPQALGRLTLLDAQLNP